MKILTNVKYILVATFLILSSCTKDFDTINENPNAPSVVTADLLLAKVIQSTATRISLEAWGGGNVLAQHSAVINFTDFDRYNWNSNARYWNNLYGNMRDVNDILEIAETTENPNYKAVALILKSWVFMQLTDSYGDVPFSKSGLGKSGGNFQPEYDTQESIYNTILDDLTASANLIDESNFPIAGDLIYTGDLSKWKKFANTLKIRALMRISNKRSVASDIQSIVNSGDIFQSNDDNAVMKYLDARPNTWPVHTYRVGSFDEKRMSNTIETVLKDRNDPRLENWFRTTDNPDDDPTLISGMPNGLSENNATTYNGGAANVSRLAPRFYEEPNSVDAIIMEYAELQFILAEAAFKGMISGDAQTYYENGVRASFEYWGVEMPTDYFTRVGVAYDGNLETIMLQKWISFFFVGYEAWYDFRRTGLPTIIIPGIDNVNNDKVPVRFFYPDDQQVLNKSNYDAAVARQGADDINTKVWWEK